MKSIYWVISRDCNQRCAHCYNDSEPGAPGLTLGEVSACVENMPDPDRVPVDAFILSGGEVLVWPDLLFQAIDGLRTRYPADTAIWVQTNGDLLDAPMLDRLLGAGVSRIDVSSIDRFHRRSTVARESFLLELFQERGMVDASSERADGPGMLRYAFWGATPEQWIGPLWPRGRARRYRLSMAGPEHRFCRMWSGAKGFLDYLSPGCEANVQLDDVYPCCPMTCRPLGSLLREPLIDILDRCARHPVFRALNLGEPEAMGESLGIDGELAIRRTRELGNQCLWCDEFFSTYSPDLLAKGGRTERGRVDIDVDVSTLRKRGASSSRVPTRITARDLDADG